MSLLKLNEDEKVFKGRVRYTSVWISGSGSKIWHMMGKKIFNLLHINGLCPLFTSNRIPSRRFLSQIWILKTLFYDVLILSSIFVLMTVSSDALLVSLACLFCYESYNDNRRNEEGKWYCTDVWDIQARIYFWGIVLMVWQDIIF